MPSRDIILHPDERAGASGSWLERKLEEQGIDLHSGSGLSKALVALQKYRELVISKGSTGSRPTAELFTFFSEAFGADFLTKALHWGFDSDNRRVFELVRGKTTAELSVALAHIKDRANVKSVIIDMCDPFRNFAREFFPQASIVADKFHVLRLLNPAINRRRKAIVGDRRTHLIGRLLLRNSRRLDYFTRQTIWQWLEQHPNLKQIYYYKEALFRFYRIKGHRKASAALTALTDEMALTQIPEIKTLRKTLMKWREPILAYFSTGLTNGRTEGYNNLAKLIQRRAFGYKSFENYRLRLLNACA